MFRILGNKSGYSLLASVFQCHRRRTHQRRDQSFRSISAIFYIVNVPEWAQAQRITALSVAFIGDRETGCAPASDARGALMSFDQIILMADLRALARSRSLEILRLRSEMLETVATNAL